MIGGERSKDIIDAKYIMLAEITKDLQIDLRGIVYREGESWIVHCLELDIVAEGPTPDRALEDAVDLCAFQVKVAMEKGDLASIFRPAPAEFWRMFYSSARPRKRPIKKPPGPISRFEVREWTPA